MSVFAYRRPPKVKFTLSECGARGSFHPKRETRAVAGARSYLDVRVHGKEWVQRHLQEADRHVHNILDRALACARESHMVQIRMIPRVEKRVSHLCSTQLAERSRGVSRHTWKQRGGLRGVNRCPASRFRRCRPERAKRVLRLGSRSPGCPPGPYQRGIHCNECADHMTTCSQPGDCGLHQAQRGYDDDVHSDMCSMVEHAPHRGARWA